MQDITVKAARLPEDLGDVQRLCWAYRDHLFAGGELMRHLTQVFYPEAAYAALLNDLPAKHGGPGSGIVLAWRDGVAIGCGMYHGLNPDDAEIKRVFVVPEGRGTGAGEAISRALIGAARSDGYSRVLLDTNPDFTSARSLYEKLGFRGCDSYTDMPEDIARMLVFYELKL